MRKYSVWILMLLLLCGTLLGCRRNGTPTVPAAPMNAPESSSLPDVSTAPNADASVLPDAAPSTEPVRDGSYREYEVTYPSRGVNVRATVVLPGSTTIHNAPSMSPDAVKNAGASPDAASASPNADSTAAASAAPDAAGSPDTAGQPTGTDNAGTPNADAQTGTGTVDISPAMEVQPSAQSTGSSTQIAEMQATTTPAAEPISTGEQEMPEGGWPLVVLLHGHGGERNENGGYREIAHTLARYGIASIRMDFAGSGESEEPFPENTLTSMYTDALAAIDFAKATYPINEQAIGVFGFDMGGRVALHLIAQDLFDFRAVVLLAPANRNEDLLTRFGGQEEWERYKMDAELNNYTRFTTESGQTQDLSIQWFSDLEANDDPAGRLENRFQRRALVIYATNDTTVSPDTSRYVADMLGAETVLLESGGHSYGFYAESEALLRKIADMSAEFFARTLTE